MGNHWGTLFDDSKVAVTTAAVKATEGRILLSNMGIKPSPEAAGAVAYTYPETALRYMLISEVLPKTKQLSMISAFPYCHEGLPVRLKVLEIKEWEYGCEAQITAEFDDTVEVGFFDTHYVANKGAYREGQAYTFTLSGLAYRLEVINAPTFKTTLPLDVHQHLFPDEPYNPKREYKHTTAGLAAFLPLDDGPCDDFDFQAPVSSVERFEMDGQEIFKLRITVLRLDKDLDLILYAPRRVINGDRLPKVGDDVQGRLWLQGYLDPAQSIPPR